MTIIDSTSLSLLKAFLLTRISPHYHNHMLTIFFWVCLFFISQEYVFNFFYYILGRYGKIHCLNKKAIKKYLMFIFWKVGWANNFSAPSCTSPFILAEVVWSLLFQLLSFTLISTLLQSFSVICHLILETRKEKESTMAYYAKTLMNKNNLFFSFSSILLKNNK